MPVTQQLVDAAISQALERFPRGDAGGAALLVDSGEILTSVCFESLNDSTHLCHEVGAICEAFRRNLTVVASVCVSRRSDDAAFVVLTACGVCQERLSNWGRDVHVGVPHPDDRSKWVSRSLREIQPYYWRDVFETPRH